MAGNPFLGLPFTTGTPSFGFTAPGTTTSSTQRNAAATTTLGADAGGGVGLIFTTLSTSTFTLAIGTQTTRITIVNTIRSTTTSTGTARTTSTAAGFFGAGVPSSSTTTSSAVGFFGAGGSTTSSNVISSTSASSRSSTPTPTGSSSASNTGSNSASDAANNGLTSGQLAAAIAVPIIVVLLIALGLFLFCGIFRRRKQRANSDGDDEAKAAGAGVSGRGRGLKGKLFGGRLSGKQVASSAASTQEKSVAGYADSPPPYLSGTGTSTAGAGAAVAGATAGGVALGASAHRETNNTSAQQAQPNAQMFMNGEPTSTANTSLGTANANLSPGGTKEVLLSGTGTSNFLAPPSRPDTAKTESGSIKSFNSSLYSETASVHSAKAQRVSSVFAQMSIRGTSEDGGSSRGGDSPPPPPLPSDAAAMTAAAVAASKAHGDYPFLDEDPSSQHHVLAADDGDATPRPRDHENTDFFAATAAAAAANKEYSAHDPKEDQSSSSNDDHAKDDEKNFFPSSSLPHRDPATIAALAAMQKHTTPVPSRSPSTDYLRLAATQTANSGITASSGEGFVTPRSQRSFADVGQHDGGLGGRRSEMTMRSSSSSRDSFGDAREEIA